MGVCGSKGYSENLKRDKNHNRQKMFRFGISFGRNDLNLEGHLQAGYTSKTVKNYGPAAIKPPTDNAVEETLPVIENIEPSIMSS